MPIETLRKAIFFAMTENLIVQFLVPDAPLPPEYEAQMRQVENAARAYDGRERMAAFDGMVDLYDRACSNPEALATLDRWEKFTAQTVEAF